MCKSDVIKIQVQDVLNVVHLLENILDILLNLWFECILLDLSTSDIHHNHHQVFEHCHEITMISMGPVDQGWMQDFCPRTAILSKACWNLLIVVALLGKSNISSCFSTSSSSSSSKQWLLLIMATTSLISSIIASVKSFEVGLSIWINSLMLFSLKPDIPSVRSTICSSKLVSSKGSISSKYWMDISAFSKTSFNWNWQNTIPCFLDVLGYTHEMSRIEIFNARGSSSKMGA